MLEKEVDKSHEVPVISYSGNVGFVCVHITCLPQGFAACVNESGGWRQGISTGPGITVALELEHGAWGQVQECPHTARTTPAVRLPWVDTDCLLLPSPNAKHCLPKELCWVGVHPDTRAN